MFPIVQARFLAPTVKRFEVEAPRIARKQRPGQFVIIRLHENGERIPLTIAGSDPARGTISLIVQSIGKTTTLMNMLEAGDAILDVVGPLGKPSEIHPYGTVVVIGGGVGSAIALPTAQAMKQAGNRVISIIGARTRELLILEEEFRATSDLVLVMTDDGSYGEKGFVTDALKHMLTAGYSVDLVLAIGPVPMMRAVSEVTRPAGIRTIVSLNSIMVDGTGMCGGCRVLVSGASQFACVDGPEFDAHIVDFDVLMQRNAMYRAEETRALADFNRDPERDLALVRGSCAMEAMEIAERKAGTDAD
jgi:ferredoxin--NADP+ reductase